MVLSVKMFTLHHLQSNFLSLSRTFFKGRTTAENTSRIHLVKFLSAKLSKQLLPHLRIEADCSSAFPPVEGKDKYPPERGQRNMKVVIERVIDVLRRVRTWASCCNVHFFAFHSSNKYITLLRVWSCKINLKGQFLSNRSTLRARPFLLICQDKVSVFAVTGEICTLALRNAF